MSSQFEKVNSTDLDPGVRVSKYRSPRTGLTVCVADVPGPVVNGFFCLATEAHDDDGLPHTLEHLVFLGSEKYPYKGVLDLLANRCFARGTNAWTDVDYTCYTLTTAGSEGFLQILPAYLDHILYPTLTDEGYVTEVHHITGSAEDAGVVYCEMQARENTMNDLTARAMLRAMYPGHCGYKSETGGILENLRVSTSNKKVRDYHHEFYRPENLCIIVTGHVEVEALFAAIQPFEDRILSKGERGSFQRPWQTPVPALEKSVTRKVPFPSDDVSSGTVTVSWRGPSASDQRTLVALQTLWEYLTDSPVAPLQRDLVEIDEPFASSLDFSLTENAETCMTVSAENVPTEQLGEVYDLIMKVLDGISCGREEMDMSRIGSLINRSCLDMLDKLEDSPHNTLADNFIGDFLYGQAAGDFTQRMELVATLKSLQGETCQFWQALLKKFVIGTPYVLVIGEPSAQLAAQLAEEEETRVAAQHTTIGEDGLGALQSALDAAKAKNDVEAPQSMLSSLSIPSINSISFHSVSISTNNPRRQLATSPAWDLASLPLVMEVDNIRTSFVEVVAVLDTACLSDEQRLYLPLYLEVLFESPVVRNGKVIDYEQVITELERDLLNQGAALGFYCGSAFRCGSFGELAVVSVKTEMSKYAIAVRWLEELLYAVKFTKSRVRSVAKKMKKEITEQLRSGGRVAKVLARHINFQSRSNHINSSMLSQRAFLISLLRRLDSEAVVVCSELDQLRCLLARPSNTVVRVVTNVQKLQEVCPDPLEPWRSFIASSSSSSSPAPTAPPSPPPVVMQSAAFVQPYGTPVSASQVFSNPNVILGLKSEESSYLVQTCPGITGFDNADTMALQVFVEYLIAMEGPMWRLLRGAGLSYDYNVTNASESGLLYFSLSKCTNLLAAYKEGRRLLLSYADGEAEFESVKVEAAISSVVFSLIQDEEGVFDAAEQAFINYYRQVPVDFQRRQLQQVVQVTQADMRRVAAKYFKPLFEPATSRCVICCNSSKVEEITTGLSEFGVNLVSLPGTDKLV
ncbi:uncharacterized protein C05D11.1-like [Sycon ciliatum]|uniref:uncharacterized protein C05D11.1-like n=1 Tax=Sycon ciliatum TaxID=27933 RepID=UPI0020AB99C0|eukprot:scpid34394/ scgid15802/ Uncharacterized protein C05D11.1